MLLHWRFFDVSLDLIEMVRCVQKRPLWLHSAKSLCLVTGDNCGPSVTAVSVGFLHSEVAFFTFVLNKYLVGRFSDHVQISHHSVAHQL